MDLIQAIVLGIVQGLTEFLPISSTAHLRIVPSLLGWNDPGAAFTASIQLGTLLAVLIYFRRDLWAALVGWLKSFRGGEAAKTTDAKLGWAIVIGSIPIGVLGLLFQKRIEGSLRSLYVIAGALIVMGILMWIADRVPDRMKSLDQTSVGAGIWVGFWQAIALIPGASRSGSTITGALFWGMDRETAARFSFMLSVPAILAAALYSFKQHAQELLHDMLVPMLVANLFSFITGYAAIAFLIKFLQTKGPTVFVVYRVALGVLLLVLLSRGILTPMVGIPEAVGTGN